jgi:two-component system response regulator YesN
MHIKKNWFYRTLYSYLPIFFIVTSILFLTFFVTFSEYIKQSTLESNQVFGKQVKQAVENILAPVDKAITREILVDETMRRFFDEKDLQTYTVYQTHERFVQLLSAFPIIDSIYAVRHRDGIIVSDSMFTSLDKFEDSEFIREKVAEERLVSWSGNRSYADSKRVQQPEVVSLVRKVPFFTGNSGLVVINVKVAAIRELVVNMSSLDVSFVRLHDHDGNLIFSTGDVESNGIKELTLIKSDFTGWDIRNGIKERRLFDFFSAFSTLWAAFGLLCMIVGPLLIIYVTRQKYKPIESLMDIINGVFLNKDKELFVSGNQDEIRLISLAIDHLVEQSNRFQNQFEEDVLSIRRNLFLEILEGSTHMNLEQWKVELGRLSLPVQFNLMSLSILEIDRYSDFTAEYSDRDQFLLKFAVKSMLEEITQENNVQMLSEWITDSQLGIIFVTDQSIESASEKLNELIVSICNKAISWANENLKFTITFGIGGSTGQLEEIPQLYDDALDALKYKSILGNQRVIDYCDLPDRVITNVFDHIQLIRSLARAYRMGEAKWHSDFHTVMHAVKTGLFTREDVISILHYLVFYLDREVMELAGQIKEKWRQGGLPKLSKLLDYFETLEEFQGKSEEILTSMFEDINLLRENRTKHQLIHKMRKYIEDNFSDPNLSLIHLSDEFDLSTRYLSRLFKDEFGEKFVDYLIRVRMDRAYSLLIETSEPVQDIALKVGYVHSFSFIRVFKKTVGLTPGDFRNNARKGE